ncbi:type II secretion system protein [Campylobacterota bacterium]
MQRKSNFLNKKQTVKNRKGMAMIVAIAFLIITAVLMAIMVRMTAQSTKQTTDIYLQEQAHLLAKSATEFALLAISGHDRGAGATSNCVTNINTQYPGAGAAAFYDINTSIQYIGLNCSANSLVNNISTPESNGTVIIDTYVTTTDTVNITEPVRFHRRTMQKP